MEKAKKRKTKQSKMIQENIENHRGLWLYGFRIYKTWSNNTHRLKAVRMIGGKPRSISLAVSASIAENKAKIKTYMERKNFPFVTCEICNEGIASEIHEEIKKCDICIGRADGKKIIKK